MQTKAIVTKNTGTHSEILVMRSEACGSCHACNGCHAEPTRTFVENTLGLQVGEAVIVEMPDKRFFQSVGWLYLLPMVLFVGGIVLGSLLQRRLGLQHELLSVAGGVLGLFLFWIIIRLVNRKSEGKTMMRMVRKTDLLADSEADGAPEWMGKEA